MSTLGVGRLVNASIPYARSSRKDSGRCIYRVLGGHGAHAEWRNDHELRMRDDAMR